MTHLDRKRRPQTHWRRKWQPNPMFLPGKSHGQKSLTGNSPWGCRAGQESTRMSKVVSTPTATKMKVIWQNENVREFLAEFISTYVMMVFGLGAVAHMVLGGKMGSYLAVNLGFGFGVTIGIHMAGNISGAHMNAAVTFTSCALGRMSWKKFPVYVLGQFLGSFVAAATIYSLFYTAIIDFSGGKLMVTGPTATANIFATYLPDHMTLWRGFLDEVVVTGMLQLCLLAITDKGNNPTLLGTQAIVTGILIVIIGVSLGMNSGYAINPSRDLPPRFFTFLAGWGSQVFRTKDWWWVPVVAPPLGAYCGAIIYLFFIGSNKPEEPQVLENPSTIEDRRVSVLPKTVSHQHGVASLTPVSVYPEDRSSVLYHP